DLRHPRRAAVELAAGGGAIALAALVRPPRTALAPNGRSRLGQALSAATRPWLVLAMRRLHPLALPSLRRPSCLPTDVRQAHLDRTARRAGRRSRRPLELLLP